VSISATSSVHLFKGTIFFLELKHLGLDDFWRRLLSMRSRNQRHEQELSFERNLLTKLHSIDSPLRRQRESTRRAVLHWFLRGQEEYPPEWVGIDASHCSDKVIELLSRAGNKMVVDELERRWECPVSKINYLDDGTGFWTEAVLGAFESGNGGHTPKLLPDKQRKKAS
jgi:hypothetical protein